MSARPRYAVGDRVQRTDRMGHAGTVTTRSPQPWGHPYFTVHFDNGEKLVMHRDRLEHLADAPEPAPDPEPDEECSDCFGTGEEHERDLEYGLQPTGGGTCPNCHGTGVEPPDPDPEPASEFERLLAEAVMDLSEAVADLAVGSVHLVGATEAGRIAALAAAARVKVEVFSRAAREERDDG